MRFLSPVCIWRQTSRVRRPSGGCSPAMTLTHCPDWTVHRSDTHTHAHTQPHIDEALPQTETQLQYNSKPLIAPANKICRQLNKTEARVRQQHTAAPCFPKHIQTQIKVVVAPPAAVEQPRAA